MGLVSHPAPVTSGNSGWDLYTPATLGTEDQGVTTVYTGDTFAIRGQPTVCSMPGIFLGMGSDPAHTLPNCLLNSSTATSPQNMGTLRLLPSIYQAAYSLTLPPDQCGWSQTCDCPGTFSCPRPPDSYNRDPGSTNSAPWVTSSCLYRNYNCQEEGTGNQTLQGKSRGVPGKGQNWPFDPGQLGHKDLQAAALQKVSLLEHLLLRTVAWQKVTPLEYPLLYYTLVRATCTTCKSCHGSFTTNNCVLYMWYTHTR